VRDVQSEPDTRSIPIDRVGIRRVRYPLSVEMRDGSLQTTVAVIDLAVDLVENLRGAHMSRFFDALETTIRSGLTPRTLEQLLELLLERFESDAAYVRVAFPLFVDKKAPVTGTQAPVAYDCAYSGSLDGSGSDCRLEVVVPVTTLCPCSQAMADQGAHNQRAKVKVVTRFNGVLWAQDLVEQIESCASCGIYAALKRPDEKYVTERAYARPRFVEDLVRDVAHRLEEDSRVTWFVVEAESHESIHDHDAYAFIKRSKS